MQQYEPGAPSTKHISPGFKTPEDLNKVNICATNGYIRYSLVQNGPILGLCNREEGLDEAPDEHQRGQDETDDSVYESLAK